MKRRGVLQHCAPVAGALWGLYATSLAAAPLHLSEVPLFLGLKVEPNILFVVDDSGSMDGDIMTRDVVHSGRFTNTQPDGTDPDPGGSGAVRHRDDDHDGTPDCIYANGSFYGYMYITEFDRNTYHDSERDCNTADEYEWRVRNFNFNSLYFNPFRTYKPWSGVDKNGNPFQDMEITRAKANPYDPHSETLNLLIHSSDMRDTDKTRLRSDRNKDGIPDGFTFYLWHDKDQDGLFDNGEEVPYRLSTLKDGDIPGKSAAEVRQNFANWFSYHRSRMLTAKATYSEIIADATGVRMGLATINNNNNAKIHVQPMNVDAATGNKRKLLDTLYSMTPDKSTPLPEALRQAGLYFECKSTALFSTCPAADLKSGGACQQNLALVMTDGFYNVLPLQGVGNADGNRNTQFDGGAHADQWTDTLADIAMHFYERDLHTQLPDLVPTGMDEAKHQHMATYMVTFGAGLGSISSDPPDRTKPFSWPQPDLAPPLTVARARAVIDDGRHAAYNSRGLFFSATDPVGLAAGLQKVLSNVVARTSAAASVALSAGTRQANSRVYQARFDSSDWSGQLLSFPVAADGTLGAPEWDAATVLDGQDPDTGRVILTYDATATPPVGRPFRWASLNPSQQALLSSSGTDTLGARRLDYVRGSKKVAPTGTFRARRHVLGDVIHSEPFFVGAPFLPEHVGGNYETFRSAMQNRPPLVVVGGNDGMLHIFDARTGAELLGYVPNALFGRLQELTAPQYQHRFYVDGSPTAGDVVLAGQWRTVVVGGLRSGGRGYYALDITEPSAFDEKNAANLVLWEFTSAQDPDLGFTFSQPSLVRMANGKWAAVFGNGYNNPGSGRAALFIVFLEGGRHGTWQQGLDYIKIDTGVGSLTTPNGLATPAVIDLPDRQGHGFGDVTADFIVAGDLQGNMWKFDVRDANPAQWRVAYGSAARPLPLFQARDADGKGQPITARPEVGAHPLEAQSFMVYFGTGKYLEPADNAVIGVTPQSFYGVSDQPLNGAAPYDRNRLTVQTIVATTTVGASQVRVVSDHTVNLATTSGWVLDLPLPGERQVSDAVLRNGRIIFTTLVPNEQPCSFGGTSWIMELDALSGARLAFPPFDLNKDGSFDQQDMASIASGGQNRLTPPSGLESSQGILPRPTTAVAGGTERQYHSGSAGGVMVTTENPGPGAVGRQAWQQIYQ